MKTESFSATNLSVSASDTQLLLEGQLVIRNAGILKKELLSAFANSQNLEIIFKNIVKADMSFVQLIIALQKSTGNPEKEVSFDEESKEYMKSIIGKSGLGKIPGINLQA